MSNVEWIAAEKTPREVLIWNIAKVCHETNRAYCETLGDFSQMSWDEAPKWQRESIINGVIYALENVGITPEQSHANWLAEKRKEGWSYGEKKDITRKEHPCFVTYGELPPEQKIKDRLFLAVVASFAQN